MQIEKIEFKSALLADKKQANDLPVKKWYREGLPKIKELSEEHKPWELSGCYGDPLIADPIAYQPISFIGKGKTEVIEFFHPGIIFFMFANNALRRIFRCLLQFKNMS